MDEATFISMIQEAWLELEEMGPIPSSAEPFDVLLTSLTTPDSIPYLAMLRSQFKNSLDPFSAVVNQNRRGYSSCHNANRVDTRRRAHHTRLADPMDVTPFQPPASDVEYGSIHHHSTDVNINRSSTSSYNIHPDLRNSLPPDIRQVIIAAHQKIASNQRGERTIPIASTQSSATPASGAHDTHTQPPRSGFDPASVKPPRQYDGKVNNTQAVLDKLSMDQYDSESSRKAQQVATLLDQE
jgi:hypothetical protein